ncbi:hypothetical protein LSCM1_04811 [Leishmania martiniquensis]|uniref:J domain-containing protein n=1 Tax=Leishmania martiniquensis TaxID=1580590 RepID=A0A836GZW8_9TRYP|nr:hypothetical protein LSCM1_04811 [Leishmania martiniquensis]
MDRLAGNFLRNGDVASASSLYNSLEKLNPDRYSRMARICRVLLNPQEVPLPHRHRDICEALLDPLVPPEVLLRDSAESVHKSFQRLAVCAHPDKNPNPSANEAFLRLTVMKDKALALLRDGMERPCGAAEVTPAKATASKRHKRKPTTGSGAAVPTVAHERQPLKPGAPSPAAAAVSSSLAQLRSTKITLSALKRKDIADDFEIFSATQRTTAVRSEVSLSDEEVHLAATVPVIPTKEIAQRTNRRRPQPTAPPEKKTISQRTPSPCTDPLMPSSLCVVMSAPSRISLPHSPLGAESRSKSGGAGVFDRPALHSPVASSDDLPADSNALRRQIDETCARLREMRVQHTSMRLDLDLSFEAYVRRKQSK